MSKILIAVDFYDIETTDGLILHALKIADTSADELIILNIVDVESNAALVEKFSDAQQTYFSVSEKHLKEKAKMLIPSGQKATTLVKSGRSYVEIVETAAQMKADMIIIGAHKPSMKDYLLGMTAARVVRHAHCSVTVIRH